MNEPDAIAVVKYAGEPLVTFAYNGAHVISLAGCEAMRVKPGLLTVESTLVASMQYAYDMAMLDPYQTALKDSQKVYNAIPMHLRRGMRLKDIETVIDAIGGIANEGIQ